VSDIACQLSLIMVNSHLDRNKNPQGIVTLPTTPNTPYKKLTSPPIKPEILEEDSSKLDWYVLLKSI
jgi:hypothetical protein